MARVPFAPILTAVLFGAGTLGGISAAPAQFTIDPERTTVTLSGVAAGLTVVEQGPGSLTTAFEGQILAELDGSGIHFPGNSVIDALTNGDWRPKANGEEGTEPADFGAEAGSILLSGVAALRDVKLDLQSLTAIPVNGGEFSADGLLFVFPEASPSAFDYRINSILFNDAARRTLAGYATNQIATVGWLTTEGDTQTLTIPIEATITFELLGPGDSTLTIVGQLVATRSIIPVSELIITSVRLNEGNLVFEWNAEPGETYRVESSANLSDWTEVAAVPAGESSWQVPAGAGFAFFRVVK